jgi:hypothetical protein
MDDVMMTEMWCSDPTPQQKRRLQHSSAYRAEGIPARVFVIPLLLQLSGPFDVARLKQALSALTSRHEALRYRFHEHVAGHWMVTSSEEGEVRLTVVDPASDIGQAMWTADLGTATLERLVNFRPGSVEHLVTYLSSQGDVHRLLLLVDHLVADGDSCELLLRDLARFYRDSVPASAVTPDIAGRDGIKEFAAVCETTTIPERVTPLAEQMKTHTAFAWVDLPVLQSWETPQRDAIVTDSPLPFDLEQFDAACFATNCTRFGALIAATHVALREYSTGPGYLYLYPSLRELFDLTETVGWFSGMAVVELEPADLDLAELRRRYTSAVGQALTDGWAISEHLHAYARTHERLPTRPSVSVHHIAESRERTWDFGTCSALEIPTQQPRVPVRGRICVGLAATPYGIALRLLSEPGRFDQQVIDNLGHAAARCLTAMVTTSAGRDDR